MKEFEEPKELLPDWGPYSKKYMGISRIISKAAIPGARMDCVVHPMLSNANQPAPNVTFPTSWHIWEASPDLTSYTCRVELEWKDQVYADVSFSAVDEHTRLIRTEYVNNTDLDQNCVLNYYLAIEYPWKKIVKPHCEEDFVWKKFTDYTELSYRNPRPWEHLMPDGLHRGEFFDPNFTEGRGFGDRTDDPTLDYKEIKPFGKDQGDCVTLTLTSDRKYEKLVLGYRTPEEIPAVFRMVLRQESGKETDKVLSFPVSDTMTVLQIPIDIEEGELKITLISEGKGGIELDFASLCSQEAEVVYETFEPEFVPVCTKDETGYGLEYEGVAEKFKFIPLTDQIRVREIPTGTLEDALVSRLSQADPSFDEVTRTFTSAFTAKHSDPGFYQNFIVHSIFIPAGQKHVEYALISDQNPVPMTTQQAEDIYRKAREAVKPLDYNTDGKKYEFSNRMLQATLLMNVVYPIYRHGTWIKHHTPGKRWDSLYTWDSGFIGMGLLESEPRLAEYVLDLYLSNPDNEDFAFLMHGSPVPVQAYLYLELLQRSKDKEKLLSWYPRMKRYYEFMAGKGEGSTTDPFASRLTTTFDYFYNCSGMDDLPPQVAMYAQKKKSDCAPALTTSQLIRMAKILRMIAAEEGMTEDVKVYDEDIALRSHALQTYAWDEESGYFGYVVHDENKQPVGIFKNESGENYSKGMDGIYPLIAGICTKEQEERILGHLFSEKEMFSRVGISAVDQSASYYQPNGYWNGNVWFSHQWFIWKTMLDLGKTE
ncbi:MAG: MGH1-like glycoside hydrolase domain-containing protein, partial [Oliverpabstia sp.]